jgi:hypothetical protein
MSRKLGEPLPLRVHCLQGGCDFESLLLLPIQYIAELMTQIGKDEPAIDAILDHHNESRGGELTLGFKGHDQFEAFDETGVRFAGLLVSSYAVVLRYDPDYDIDVQI